MPSEDPFRIALLSIFGFILVVGVYHRWQAAKSGDRISRKQEGLLLAVSLRIWESTIMSKESRILAGVLLITYPTVIFGGVSLLSLLVFTEDYAANPLRQDLWRAGHAHAGVYLLLSLVVLRYVDEANFSDGWKWAVRLATPIAAILVPLAFFVSILDPKAQEPNRMIYLAYVGAVVLAFGLFILGVGLVRGSRDEFSTHSSSAFWRSP